MSRAAWKPLNSIRQNRIGVSAWQTLRSLAWYVIFDNQYRQSLLQIMELEMAGISNGQIRPITILHEVKSSVVRKNSRRSYLNGGNRCACSIVAR